jgi:hypothetical protein
MHISFTVESTMTARTRARAEGCQERIAISFLTDFTPLTALAIRSAVSFSVAFLAKPDSITVPFSVSTRMLDEARFHRGGDRGVVDIGADRFLAPRDGTAGGGEKGDGGHGGGEGAADVHDGSPVKMVVCSGSSMAVGGW